jgi:hypothetical protein
MFIRRLQVRVLLSSETAGTLLQVQPRAAFLHRFSAIGGIDQLDRSSDYDLLPTTIYVSFCAQKHFQIVNPTHASVGDVGFPNTCQVGYILATGVFLKQF